MNERADSLIWFLALTAALLWHVFLWQRLSLGVHDAAAVPQREPARMNYIYQPGGIPASVAHCLRHLRASGYTPRLIVNGRTPECDLVDLLPLVDQALLRPNVGYDFGGWRDSLRLMWTAGERPRRLLLLNDSTWFPLFENDDSLSRMEALGADLAGQVFKTEYADRPRHDHVEAHCMMMSERLIASPAFRAFWEDYVMSDSRASTVEHGEKGLTQAVQRAGLTVDGLITKDRFVAAMNQLDNTAFREMLGYITHHRADARAEVDAALAHADWRAATLGWIEHVLANSRQHLISATFFEPAMHLCGLSFMKKADDPRYRLARAQLLTAEDTHRLPPIAPCIRAEIAARVRQDGGALI